MSETIRDTTEVVTARMLRIAADAAEQGDSYLVAEICEAVIEELRAVTPHWGLDLDEIEPHGHTILPPKLCKAMQLSLKTTQNDK